jgi:hypothetical protein
MCRNPTKRRLKISTAERRTVMAHVLVEEFQATGKELIDRVRDILEEGRVRRMVIKNSKGKVLFELPLALGVIGVGGAFAIAPVLSAIATFAFLAKDTRVIVEKYPRRGKYHLSNELHEKKRGGRRQSAKASSKQAGSKPDRQDHSNPGDGDPFEIDADFEVLDE